MKNIFLVVLSLLIFSNAKADFTVRDVGTIGLMSHDIFSWDHKTEVNKENGRLDLSTIFDYDGGTRWEKGGNPKNSENAPVYTVTMSLVGYYKDLLKTGLSPVQARQWTVRHFIGMVEDSYVRVFHSPFPYKAINAMPTNTEQASLRGMHDILPGKIKLYGRWHMSELVVTNLFQAKTLLNKKEMDQPIKNFDGDYDEEYKHIKIPFGPTINLKEIDGKFIKKFSPYTQEEMLTELAGVGRSEKELSEAFFAHHIYEMLQKAICNTGNQWMPPEIICD